MKNTLKVFSGSANPALAEKICRALKTVGGKVALKRFRDGEIRVKIEENVRGADVFVIQPTHPPAENLMELLLMLDALKRASADRITAVIPYYGYARQDRKDEPRVPLSAKLIANLIVVAGADRILTMDLHAEQIQGFFDVPVDHLYSTPVLVQYFKKQQLKNLVVVSPDPGRVNRARAFAKRLGNVPIAIIDKRRPAPNVAEVVNVVGEVGHRTALIFDDMIDTGGSIIGAGKALIDRHATRVYACATHPVFSGGAEQKLFASPIAKVVVTDTIPLDRSKLNKKIEVLSIAGLLGEAIRRIHYGQSVSSLFI
jgi:ribose-phosphate pyrophosphokinase